MIISIIQFKSSQYPGKKETLLAIKVPYRRLQLLRKGVLYYPIYGLGYIATYSIHDEITLKLLYSNQKQLKATIKKYEG